LKGKAGEAFHVPGTTLTFKSWRGEKMVMNAVTATTVALDDGARLTSNIMPWRTHLYILKVAKIISNYVREDVRIL
jgi:hypothetical protein